jgi:hypothetical protein
MTISNLIPSFNNSIPNKPGKTNTNTNTKMKYPISLVVGFVCLERKDGKKEGEEKSEKKT